MKTDASISGAIGLLVFSIAPLLVGIFLLVMRHHTIETRADAARWIETPCVIEVCEWDHNEDGRYLEFGFRYAFAGENYQSHELDAVAGRFGDDDLFEESVFEQYPPGASGVCYVNPDDPSKAVFNRQRGADAPRRLFLLAFPFLTVGGVFSSMLILATLTFILPQSTQTPSVDDLPRPLRLTERITVMAGPLGSQLAWLFLVAFLFVFIILDGPASWGRLFRATSSTAHLTEGTILDVRSLVGHEFGVTIYQNQFEYEWAGETHTQIGFTRGQRYEAGQTVPIQIDPDQPDRAILAGARPGEFVWWHSAIPLAIVGLLLIGLIGMYRQAWRAVWLLRNGKSATAQRHATDTSPNAEMGSGYHFEVDGNWIPAQRFHHDGKDRAETLPVLYSHRHPRHNVLVSEALRDSIAAGHRWPDVILHCSLAPVSIALVVILLRGGGLL